APAAAATPAAASPAPGARCAGLLVLAIAIVLLGFGRFARGLLLLVLVRLLFFGGLFSRRRLDLGLDLVAQVELAAGGVLSVWGEVVLLAELAQLRGGDLELVGDPGVGAALAHPGADLVQLWLQ